MRAVNRLGLTDPRDYLINMTKLVYVECNLWCNEPGRFAVSEGVGYINVPFTVLIYRISALVYVYTGKFALPQRQIPCRVINQELPAWIVVVI